MKETNFIKQNREKWELYEKILDSEEKDPDKLKNIFIEITDDLSYSRTFYSNRSVRVYLNGIAQKIFQGIYKNKKSEKSRLRLFWTDELPLLVYQSRASFKLAFIVFLASFLIGALSSAIDIDFSRIILGDAYVDMTLENIESGDPMKVYKESEQFGMSLGITLNNLFVAFMTFIMGVFYVVGTLGFLLRNGIMVGAFQYFFYEQGLLQESFLTIWIHGTLEISAIIIAGAAGITMGKGLVFPGTLSRIKSFQISAKRGLKIMIGIVPIFIIAGFIEGYLTRMTETPDILRAFFILACLAFVLFYFVYYPIKKSKSLSAQHALGDRIPPEEKYNTVFYKIKTSSELFADTFRFYRRHLKSILISCLFSSVVYIVAVIYLIKLDVNMHYFFVDIPFQKLSEIPQFFYSNDEPLFFFFSVILFSLNSFLVYNYLDDEVISKSDKLSDDVKRPSKLVQFIYVAFINVFVLLIAVSGSLFSVLLVVFAFPVVLIWMKAAFVGRTNIFLSLQIALKYYFNSFSNACGLLLALFVFGAFFYAIGNTTLFWFYVDLIAMNLNLDQESLNTFINSLLVFSSFFTIVLFYLLFVIGFSFFYYSQREQNEAINLKKKISQITIKQSIRGIEREV